MKEIQTIATAQNFSAINVGKLDQLGEYELHLGPTVFIPGKVFGGAALHATGGDFSFQVFPAGAEKCVQYRGNTFTADDAADADILNEPVRW